MILHLELSTGASGDKLLGALVELCETQGLLSFDSLAAQAREVLPGVALMREEVVRGGISATHITVEEHTLHEHAHAHEHGHGHHTPQLAHRYWRDIRELISSASGRGLISKTAAQAAIRVFLRVARAEAKVHGTAVDEVQFHEVGAADSLIDILCNSIMLDALRPTALYATPLALGSGTFVCEHGTLPVPAPATAEILAKSHVPVYASSHAGELTTPTGAALIAEFATSFAPLPCSRPQAVGYGAGSRDLAGAANVLRVISAEPVALAGLRARESEQLFVEGVTQLECNLDHLSAEAAAFACEELLLAGALDVWQEPLTMKKGRLGAKLVLLTKPEEATELAQKTIELTGSLGVRSRYLERTVIPRSHVTLATPYGPVPFKAAEMGAPENRRHWLRPEHDAVQELARKHALTYASLYAELQGIAESLC